jgi:hypothetical protein
MRRALSVHVLALAISVGAPAYAQQAGAEPTPAQIKLAAEAFDHGREAYKAEEYVEAAEQFEKADANAPSSAALELAVRARDKAGELDRAATLMALALKRHPDDGNLLKLAPDLSKRASEKLYEVVASCDQPCDLTVGGKIVHGAAYTERTLYLTPGSVVIRAGWSDNRSDSKQVQAEAGGKGQVSFVAPTTAAAASMAQEPTEPVVEQPKPDPNRDQGTAKKATGWSPTIFFVGVGLTAVVGGITIWSGIDTLNNPGTDAVKEECKTPGPKCDELYQQGVDNQRRTNILIGVTAGVAVATGLIGVLATDWSGGKSAPAATALLARPKLNVTPWASLDGGGVQAVGRF